MLKKPMEFMNAMELFLREGGIIFGTANEIGYWDSIRIYNTEKRFSQSQTGEDCFFDFVEKWLSKYFEAEIYTATNHFLLLQQLPIYLEEIPKVVEIKLVFDKMQNIFICEMHFVLNAKRVEACFSNRRLWMAIGLCNEKIFYNQ